MDGALCSVFSRAHQGSTGGFGLLQRLSVGLAADSSFYLISELILDLYVFYDGALMSKKSCTKIGLIIKKKESSFKSNENIRKKDDGSYYVVSANKTPTVTL